MKNLTCILLQTIILSFSTLAFAQLSGNNVYKNNYNERYRTREMPNITSTDSTLTVNTAILLNKNADHYKITLGVSEQEVTVKKSLDKINVRINNFLKKLTSIGIKKSDIFVDFITQNKIYDYDIDEDKHWVSQKSMGFEIKKNIVIATDQYALIEQIISEASDFQIYDIIKVDYINIDLDSIHQKLVDESYTLNHQKMEGYAKKNNRKVLGNPKATEVFDLIFPTSQYQEYNAYESSDLDNYSNYNKKVERKGKTFYYEGIDPSGFDKVIYPTNPEIGIQYVLKLSITYDVQKTSNK